MFIFSFSSINVSLKMSEHVLEESSPSTDMYLKNVAQVQFFFFLLIRLRNLFLENFILNFKYKIAKINCLSNFNVPYKNFKYFWSLFF